MIKKLIFLSAPLLLSLCVLSHESAWARDEKIHPKTLIGYYGFDWSNPITSKCILISKRSPKDFIKSYICESSDLKGSSGVSILAECKHDKGKASYLIFKTKEDCINEKLNQDVAE